MTSAGHRGNTPPPSPSKAPAEDAFWISSGGYQAVQALEEQRSRRAEAVEKAHRQRPDLGADEFDILANLATLSGNWETAADEILAHVNAVRKPDAPVVSGPQPPALRGAPPLVEQRAQDELEHAIARARRSRARRWWPDDWPTQSEVAEYRAQLAGGWARGWPHGWPSRRDVELAQVEIESHADEPQAYEEIAAAHDPAISVRTLKRRLHTFPDLRSLLRPR
ncbi:MAG: hypothetical protein ACLQBX_15135 [Candidatus Limnocylindrales bacterium]